jgi:hypothetical protein
MSKQHPDDRAALTDQERSEFRQIWKTLADDEVGHISAGVEDLGEARLGWSPVVIICVVFVLIGLAADSGLLVMVAAGGALWAHMARRRRRAADDGS